MGIRFICKSAAEGRSALAEGIRRSGILAILMASAVIVAACGQDATRHQQESPDTPEPKPSKATSLSRAASIPGLDYSLSGTGGSAEMILSVRNETERTWVVHVEVGTKLEPATGETQNMVVTKEVHVTAHPHDHHELTLEVACLDISKAPPAESDREWTVTESAQLARFLACVDTTVDKMIREESEADLGEMRGLFVQFGLWQARGASQEQWVDFLVEYWGMSREEASELADSLSPALDELINACPRLETW